MEPKRITEEQYRDASENYQGYCTVCRKFTRDCTEPDAEGYDCPECEGDTCMGAEQALLVGEITF